MKAFQTIADDNPGPDGHPSRNSGEPGYLASALYVANLMSDWGYSVHIQTYTVPLLLLRRHADLPRGVADRARLPAGHRLEPGSGNGTTTAAIQPAGGIVFPPTPTRVRPAAAPPPTSPASYRGRVALIQRGEVQLRRQGPQRAGGGRHRRRHLQRGQPGPHRRRSTAASSTPTTTRSSRPIPVAFIIVRHRQATSYDQYNQAVAEQHRAAGRQPRTRVHGQQAERRRLQRHRRLQGRRTRTTSSSSTRTSTRSTAPACSTTRPARPRSSTVAHMMRKVHRRNKLRFIWFGGEELGLLGSRHYVDKLVARRAWARSATTWTPT